MHRVPRRRLLAAILASMALVAIAIPPIAGVAGAASTSTTCPTLDGRQFRVLPRHLRPGVGADRRAVHRSRSASVTTRQAPLLANSDALRLQGR